MPEGVYSRKKRFTFVEKEAGDVGDRTAWPMRATPAQIAEVMYRVRDARCISGSAEGIPLSGGIDSNIAQFTSATPPTALVEASTQSNMAGFSAGYTRRGYVTVIDGESPVIPMDDYDSRYFDDTTYIISEGLYGDDDNPIAYREATSERALWSNGYRDIDVTRIGEFEIGPETLDGFLDWGEKNDPFRTGFSFFGSSWVDSSELEPDIYVPYNTRVDASSVPGGQCMVSLRFNGEVAWVDVNGSGNPLDPLNELYIGVAFSIFGDVGQFVTDTEGASGYVDTGADLKLQLSGTDQYITARIFGYEDAFMEIGTVTDWVFQQTGCWPYQDGGGDVWDNATGLPA